MAEIRPGASNTRPIRLTTDIEFVYTRGRVYECLRCTEGPYQGERSKVILHIFRKHVALDNVPYYCSICKFVTTSQMELEKHLKPSTYPSQKATVDAMICNGEPVNERESLLQNLKHYLPSEEDMRRLNKEDSQAIFANRKKPQRDIIKTAMITAGLDSPHSDYTEDILAGMLQGEQLSPFSIDHPNKIPISNNNKSTNLQNNNETTNLQINKNSPTFRTTMTSPIFKLTHPLPTATTTTTKQETFWHQLNPQSHIHHLQYRQSHPRHLKIQTLQK